MDATSKSEQGMLFVRGLARAAIDKLCARREAAIAIPVFRGNLGAVRIQCAPRAGSRLFSGVDGTAVFDTLAGLDKLALQISHPVQWASCLASCVEAGARVFFELGPGHALADIAAGSYPGMTARSFDDFRSLQGVRAWLQRVTADG